MGIVRLGERDAVRISTDTRKREGQLASSYARDVGQQQVVVPMPSMDIVAKVRARHRASTRTRVRAGLPLPVEERLPS